MEVEIELDMYANLFEKYVTPIEISYKRSGKFYIENY